MNRVIATATVTLEVDVRVVEGLDESKTYADIKLAVQNQARKIVNDNLRRASSTVLMKEATIHNVGNIRVTDTNA